MKYISGILLSLVIGSSAMAFDNNTYSCKDELGHHFTFRVQGDQAIMQGDKTFQFRKVNTIHNHSYWVEAFLGKEMKFNLESLTGKRVVDKQRVSFVCR